MLALETFCAVRRNEEGFEYFLLMEMAHTMESAREKVEDTDINTPDWSKKNPVVRYSKFEINEKVVLTNKD